jgi:phage tail sheath protein FI
MPQDYHHGVRVIEVNEGARAIRTVSTAVIGGVFTADDADEKTFPLNTPVLVTNVLEAAGKAGKTGTLARSLEAIGHQAKPLSVVVRVPQGKTPEETTSNIVGTVTADSHYTGKAGKLTIDYDYTPVPPIENLTLRQRITDDYLVDFAARVAA